VTRRVLVLQSRVPSKLVALVPGPPAEPGGPRLKLRSTRFLPERSVLVLSMLALEPDSLPRGLAIEPAERILFFAGERAKMVVWQVTQAVLLCCELGREPLRPVFTE
jgi:hypothetical protein